MEDVNSICHLPSAICHKMNHIKTLFPFLVTILLWRLAVPFWNPAGILVMIPVFYYSFIRPTPWFVPFAVIMCFLTDYRADTLLFWTFSYCLFYAANGFQDFVDITRQSRDGVFVFMGFVGVLLFILACVGFSFVAVTRGIWLTLWMGVLYIPSAQLFKRVLND